MYLGSVHPKFRTKFSATRKRKVRRPRLGNRPLNLSGCDERLGIVPALPFAAKAATGLFSIASNILGKKKEKEAINAAWRGSAKEALDAYLPIMGQIPGREIGVSNMQLVWEGAVTSGVWGGSGKDVWVKDAIHGYSRCGDCLNILIPRALAAGVDNPIRIVDEYAIPEWKKQGDHWALPRGATQRQILIDTVDALVFRHSPGAPQYYGQKVVTSAPKTDPAIAPTPAAPVSPTAPASVPTLPPNASGDQVAAVVKALTDQFMRSSGAANLTVQDQIAQATDYALSKLREQGFITSSPSVQEATEQIVTEKVRGLPAWAIPAGIAALVGGAVLLTARRRRSR